MFVLPSLLKEQQKRLFVFKDDACEEDLFPRIKIDILSEEFCLDTILGKDHEFVVVVEKHEVFKSDNFITTVAVVLGCYYIFNLAYSKCLQNTMYFIQKELIGIHDGTEKLQKVLSLVCKIKTV